MVTITEEWRPVPGFERYLVSNFGRVARITSDKELSHDRAGRPHCRYHSVRLYDGKGGRKHLILHRLVYFVFKGEIPDGFQIDHIDGNRNNNALWNLQAISHEENQAKRPAYFKTESQNAFE